VYRVLVAGAQGTPGIELRSPVSLDEGRRPCLSIVIATVGRRDSLLETLRALDPGSMPPEAEVVVVDNAPERELDAAGLAEVGGGRVRLLHEPRPGKWRCLNAAIEGGLGEIVAVLDDDMTPMRGWAGKVIESVRSRPGFDLFTGKSHVEWPQGTNVPEWAHDNLAHCVCFSVLTWDGEHEREMGGIFPHPSGNHFWFRRSLLESVGRFPPGWTSEAEFCMEARSRGHRGALVSGITCGHRVQPEIVDAKVFLDRATRFGRTLACIQRNDERVHRVRPRVIAGSLKHAAAIALWTLRDIRARWKPEGRGVPLRARARMRIGQHGELLRGRSASQESR